MATRNAGDRLLREVPEWPERWKRDDCDVATGRAMVEAMDPFLRELVRSGVSETTLRRHFGNAWLLGGELIDRVDRDESLRRLSGRELLLAFIDEEEGPLCRHNTTEEEQRSFDATCRKLYRFLVSVK